MHFAYSPMTGQEHDTARATIAGLTRAKLSLSEPQWTKEEGGYRRAGEKQREDAGRDIEKNAQQGARSRNSAKPCDSSSTREPLNRPLSTNKDNEALAAIET